MKKGGLKKFFIADGNNPQEIYFLQAMKYLEVSAEEKKVKTPKTYFEHLELNKRGFEMALAENEKLITERATKKGNDGTVIKILKAIAKCKAFTDDQDKIIQRMKSIWEEGNVPPGVTKEVIRQTKGMTDPVKIFYEMIEIVPDKYFEERKGKKKINLSGDMKVILSSYLKKGDT